MKELIIDEKNAGGRLDKIIFRYLDKASSGFVYKMLRKKNITLNDKKASGSEIICEGDSIKLYLSDETIARFKSVKREKKEKSAPVKANVSKGAARQRSISLKNLIVYEDDNIVAVNKPAGILSQKATPLDTSVNDFFLDYIPSGEYFTPGISNRLDRNTSGIILAGKNLSAARELNRIISERDISKKYLALVKGKVSEEVRADAYLVKDEKTNTVNVSDVQKEGADHIVTVYRPIAPGAEVTLIEVELITGKSHQIRAHLAYLGYPLAGDGKYGDEGLNAKLKEKYGLRSQLLHAYKVEFSGAKGILEYLNGRVIEAELPLLFRKVLEGENIWQPGAQGD